MGVGVAGGDTNLIKLGKEIRKIETGRVIAFLHIILVVYFLFSVIYFIWFYCFALTFLSLCRHVNPWSLYVGFLAAMFLHDQKVIS